MTTRANHAGWLTVALLTAVACGGKAVVDGYGAGAGGSGGSTGPGGSPVCATPDPVGEMVDCGSWSTPDQCVMRVCDQAGQSWESNCQGQACQCRFNSEHRCTCTIDQTAGTFCNGSVPACCPKPFPK